MFKIIRLWRQPCHIKRITGLPKTWGQERERELKIKIRGVDRGEGRGGTLATHG
jgi:hypothetical protein